jgi:hypothetical protein
MCERGRRAALIALAALAAAPVRAQTLAEAEARLARLRTEWTEAAAAQRRTDSLRKARVATDTIRRGPVVVLAPAQLGTVIRPAVAAAATALEQRFGASVAALAGLEFIVLARGVPNITPQAPNPRVVPVHVFADTAAARRSLETAFAVRLSSAQDEGLRRWLRANLEVRPDTAAWFAAAYLDLATTPWTAARGCFAGDLAACRRALGLETNGAILDQWYAAEDQRRLVQRHLAFHLRRPQAAAARRCVDEGQDDACRATLEASLDWIDPPLAHASRVALVELALAWGGAGAYDRLQASRRPLPDRLADAARAPLDSLVASWHQRVMTAAPRSVTLDAAGAWAAFSWIVIVGFLGLRSTRWR